MVGSFQSAFKLSDLRKRILFTIAMIAVYRMGAHIPVPGVNLQILQKLVQSGVLGFLDLFSGGALSKVAIFSLGIMPYITSSIIMSLLTIVIPKLEEWSKEGESGQKKITQWTRNLTLALALIQSFSLVLYLSNPKVNALFSPTPVTKLIIVLSLTTGMVLIMWLGELITQHGIGNGMSLIIFVSILSRLPQATVQSLAVSSPSVVVLAIVILVAVAAGVVIVETAQRRIPVQYAKRIVGRKMYGGASTYIPLKINQSGVIPIIFASSLLIFPSLIAQYVGAGRLQSIINLFSQGTSPLYLITYTALIIFFAYFYTAITFNPLQYADQLRKYGGFIPGVRPGKPTAQFLDKVLTRITLPGSVFLAAIAILPTILFSVMNVQFFQQFGGTSILIVVGVSLETMRQIETQLLMRNYDGFLKK